jgi:hypothetical protein
MPIRILSRYELSNVYLSLHLTTISINSPLRAPSAVSAPEHRSYIAGRQSCRTSGWTTYQKSHIAWSMTTRQYLLQIKYIFKKSNSLTLWRLCLSIYFLRLNYDGEK